MLCVLRWAPSSSMTIFVFAGTVARIRVSLYRSGPLTGARRKTTHSTGVCLFFRLVQIC